MAPMNIKLVGGELDGQYVVAEETSVLTLASKKDPQLRQDYRLTGDCANDVWMAEASGDPYRLGSAGNGSPPAMKESDVRDLKEKLDRIVVEGLVSFCKKTGTSPIGVAVDKHEAKDANGIPLAIAFTLKLVADR